MTYNARTKTISIRLPAAAIEVLDWEAGLRGKKFRGEVRAELEERAARIARIYQLDTLDTGDTGDDDEPVDGPVPGPIDDLEMPPVDPLPAAQGLTSTDTSTGAPTHEQ